MDNKIQRNEIEKSMILIIRDYFEQLLNIISTFEHQKIELSLRRDFTLMAAYN